MVLIVSITAMCFSPARAQSGIARGIYLPCPLSPVPQPLSFPTLMFFETYRATIL